MDKFPEKAKADYAYDGAKGTLSCIPVIGGAITTLFETILSAPIDKRKRIWLESLAKTVEDLCSEVEGLSPEKLSQNEEFVSACIQASNIALRTHQDEKLKLLLSAVKNAVLLKDIDESKKLIFLRVIDEMTSLHIKIFLFLAKIPYYVEELDKRQPSNHSTNWGDARNVWDETFTDIRSSNQIIDVIIADLKRYGFVYINKFHEARLDSATTSFGNEFLKYIEEKS